MTELINNELKQRQYFHDKYSRRSYLAHAFGKRTFKHVIEYFPLVTPTFKAFEAVDLLASLAPTDPRVRRKYIEVNDWKAHYVYPRVTDDKNLLIYFHGGAFLSCGLGTHKQFVERLAIETNSPVLAVEYRQYPNAFFATSVIDCMQAVEWALDQGYEPQQISVAGDSAGGGLAMRVAADFLARGITLKNVVCLSGWLDFSTPYADYKKLASRDAYIPAKRINKIATLILGHEPLPEHSPLFGLKKGFPPVLLICGANEILRIDSEKAYAKCTEEDIDCTLHYFSGGVHAFPVAVDLFPESNQALELIVDFLK